MPKKAHKKPTASNEKVGKPRKLKQQQHRSFRPSKSIKYQGRKLPSAMQITRMGAQALWRHKKLFGGILLVYALLQIVLVQGVLRTDFSETSRVVQDVFGDQWHGLAGGFTSFTLLISTFGQSNTADAGVYQSLLLLMASLAVIWALRQSLAGHAVRIRDAYYRGMYPLVPFILVLLVMGLQMIPLFIGTWLYQTIVANGIASAFIEHVFWIGVLLLFATASAYMICSSLFALYIATLPDMTPMKALRSARGLVLHRRLMVFRKLLFLGLVLLVAFIVVLLPVILVADALAPYVFYVLTVLMVGFAHAYIYSLYRELLVDE